MANNLNDISRIYLDQVANIKKSEIGKDVDRWTQTEAVKGQDSEMRRIKASERGTDADTRNPDDPTGKNYAKGKSADVAWWKKKNQKESFSNWRTDLREIVDDPITDTQALKKVDVKQGIKNKVVINPKLTEAIAEIGGQLLEVTETEDKPEEKPQEDPQLSQKRKRQTQLKKQVLMRKLTAVRQGGGEDIVAGYEPEGQLIEKDLNAAERRALPDSDFALPGKGEGPEGKQRGAYPINDKKHARNALAMAAAHASPEKQAEVKAAVKKKFPNIKIGD